MKIILNTCIIIFILFMVAPYILAEDMPGASSSRPNVSDGYDYYDSTGNKISYSSKRSDGGYDYFDQYGNRTGSLKPGTGDGKYEFYDADDIRQGEVTSHPYGGYRYKERDEAQIRSQQLGIRQDYKYSDPYGSGIGTLKPDVLKGDTTTSASGVGGSGLGNTAAENTGLATDSQSSSTLQTTASGSMQTTTSTSSTKKTGLETN